MLIIIRVVYVFWNHLGFCGTINCLNTRKTYTRVPGTLQADSEAEVAKPYISYVKSRIQCRHTWYVSSTEHNSIFFTFIKIHKTSINNITRNDTYYCCCLYPWYVFRSYEDEVGFTLDCCSYLCYLRAGKQVPETIYMGSKTAVVLIAVYLVPGIISLLPESAVGLLLLLLFSH